MNNEDLKPITPDQINLNISERYPYLNSAEKEKNNFYTSHIKETNKEDSAKKNIMEEIKEEENISALNSNINNKNSHLNPSVIKPEIKKEINEIADNEVARQGSEINKKFKTYLCIFLAIEKDAMKQVSEIKRIKTKMNINVKLDENYGRPFQGEFFIDDAVQTLRIKLYKDLQNKDLIKPCHKLSNLKLLMNSKVLNKEKLFELNLDSNSNDNDMSALFELNMILKNEDGKLIGEPINIPAYFRFRDFKRSEQYMAIEHSKEYDFIIEDHTLEDNDIFENHVQKPDFFVCLKKKLINYEFFGFDEAPKEYFEAKYFQSFFLDNQKNLKSVLEQINYDEKDQNQTFRNKIILILFSCLKKHSIWEGKIQEISSLIFQKKQQMVWMNQKRGEISNYFNTQFLLHYFLNFSTSPLKMLISNSIKEIYPIPIFTNNWSSDFIIEGKIRNNDEIYWINQKSFTIGSVGWGSANNGPCGKSSLLNTIFFTEFNLQQNRHPICSKTAEISIDIYRNQKYKIDLIDIQAGNEQAQIFKILSKCNLLIFNIFDHERKKAFQEINEEEYKDLPKIIFIHGKKNAFLNIKVYLQTLESEFNNSRIKNSLEIELDDLQTISLSHHMFLEISKKVHLFINWVYKKSIDANEKICWKFAEYFGPKYYELEVLFLTIEQRYDKIITIFPLFQQFLKNDKSKNKMQLKTNSLVLAPEIAKIIDILSRYDQGAIFIWEKIRNFLQNLKTSKTKEFYKLYDYRTKLEKEKDLDKEEVLDYTELQQICDNIFKKSSLFSSPNLKKMLQESNYSALIKEILQIFDRQFLPNLLSFELIWREIIYLIKLQAEYKMQDPYFEENFLKLAKNYILNGYPFEIIDGDLLYMPQEFLTKVLNSLKDEVCIISVFGPQSSGKSTLLNFLFGCDFHTSTGRCTKGVYGTYYKLSNFNQYKGILILDTEGLFSGSKEATGEANDLRINFDNKLVLFCLTISDIVLINSKGDLDKYMKEALNVCLDSYITLKNGNINVADMFLVLNQNPHNTMETHLRDISNMFDDLKNHLKLDENKGTLFSFNRENVVVLTNAFDIKNINKNDNAYLSFLSEDIVKRKPTKKFYDDCCDLCQRIFTKISELKLKNKNKLSLDGALKEMDRIWQMINSYQYLSIDKNIKESEWRQKMNNFVHQEIVHFNEKIEEFKKIIHSNPDSEDFEKLESDHQKTLEKLKENSIENFENTFEKQKNEFPSLFDKTKEGFESQIIETVETYKTSCFDLKSQKKLKNLLINGEILIEEAANRVKKERIVDSREQEKIFEKAWKSMKETIEKKILKFDFTRSFLQIYNLYSNSNLDVKKKNFLLNEDHWPLDESVSFPEYKAILLKRMNDFLKKNTLRLFEYSKNTLALVLNEGKTDVKKIYFDMTKYFSKIQKKIFRCINKREILGILLDKDSLKKIIFDDKSFNKLIDEELRKIIKEINNFQTWKYERFIDEELFLRLIKETKFCNNRRKNEKKIDTFVNSDLRICFKIK